MVSIRTVGDRFDNQSITIDQTSDDKSSSWSLSLITNALSQQMLDNTSSVQADIQIVDGNNLSQFNDPNSFLLPVELAGLVPTPDGKRKVFYRQRYESKNQQRSPQLTLDGYMLSDSTDDGNYDNPFVMITFTLQNAGSGGRQGDDQRVDRQQYSGRQNDDPTGDLSRRPQRTYDDEIGNGGLALAEEGSQSNRLMTENQSDPDLNRQRQDAHQEA